VHSTPSELGPRRPGFRHRERRTHGAGSNGPACCKPGTRGTLRPCGVRVVWRARTGRSPDRAHFAHSFRRFLPCVEVGAYGVPTSCPPSLPAHPLQAARRQKRDSRFAKPARMFHALEGTPRALPSGRPKLKHWLTHGRGLGQCAHNKPENRSRVELTRGRSAGRLGGYGANPWKAA
jgi:hypothetical protein